MSYSNLTMSIILIVLTLIVLLKMFDANEKDEKKDDYEE